MAILYPNQINNVYIQGIEFTGNIISVGSDLNYSYDYSNVQTAINAATDGSLILIYPGVYYQLNTYSVNGKNLMFRGMGDSATDVRIQTANPGAITMYLNDAAGVIDKTIIDNLEFYTANTGDCIVLEKHSNTSIVYVNKVNLYTNYGDDVDFQTYNPINDDYNDYYLGYFYITYSRLYNGHDGEHYNRLGTGGGSVYAVKVEYAGESYSCRNCAANPVIHDYVNTPTVGYGYNYGDYLIKFNISSIIEEEPVIVGQNIWTVGDYIYHTAASGIDVYNSDVSSLLYQIPTPAPTAVWANDSYIYIATSISGVYRAAISGSASPYKQEPNITSNETIYLHGADDYLCVSTVSGIDRYRLSDGNRIYTQKADNYKCFQTAPGTLYYIKRNGFYSVDTALLGGRLSDWKYYQEITFDATPYNNSQIYINFNYNFPYYNCKSNGEDLRFISEYNEVLHYYIESWYPNGKIVVKVPNGGDTKIYMLYGNPHAPAASDPYNAYILYDDFDGTDIDSDKWTEVLRLDGTITVSNSIVTIQDYDNDGCELITKEKIPYGYTKVKLRAYGGTSDSQMDFRAGYSVVDIGYAAKGSIALDIIPGADDYAHRLIPYWASVVQGSKTLAKGFSIWEFEFGEGYQRSTYGGESLVASGTGIDAANYFAFHIDNGSSNPSLQIDYIAHSSWPIIETNTSVEKELWGFIKPELYAVYEPTVNWADADYVYDEFYTKPLYLNDIHVTENTSIYNSDNTIFLATDRGAHIIEEKRGDESNARKKYFFLK